MSEFHVYQGDSLDAYKEWADKGIPQTIISDGAYGVSGFDGDPSSPVALAEWYRPHIEKWSQHANSQTSLWFWNTEVGWANVHPILEANGWKYVQLCVWNKGLGHIAGRVNSKTVRTFPVVTEVCALYQKEPEFKRSDDTGDISTTSTMSTVTMQSWLRSEWKRSGLPFSEANVACGVKNAASRKYLTADHLWYYPPADHMASMAIYANEKGRPLAPGEKPYFDIDGTDISKNSTWEALRYIWNHQHGLTNVWDSPSLRSSERLKVDGKIVHTNQKPLVLCDYLVKATSNPGGIIWEPFGGLASFSVSAVNNGRTAYVAESNLIFIEAITKRLDAVKKNVSLLKTSTTDTQDESVVDAIA